jgi:hypothetical protein
MRYGEMSWRVPEMVKFGGGEGTSCR